MSTLATVNRAVVFEARRTLRNSKLRIKDLKEWSTTPNREPEPDEVEIKVTTVFGDIWAYFPKECDKRP